jgi:hypothetical protein
MPDDFFKTDEPTNLECCNYCKYAISTKRYNTEFVIGFRCEKLNKDIKDIMTILKDCPLNNKEKEDA